MIGLLLLLVATASATQTQPPRDRTAARAPVVVDSSTREAELQKRIAAAPTGVAAYIELAKLQESRGAYEEAELTLTRARGAAPASKEAGLASMGFYNRQGDFTKTMEMLDFVEHIDPTDPAAPHMTATFFWEKAYKDHRLLASEKYKYVMDGIAATDRALALKADYVEALTYKNLLLRLRAELESDPALKQQLIAEADALRNRAIELNKSRILINGGNAGVGVPPPPPPPPPPPAGGNAPLRVGGNVRAPTKVKDVRPIYPDDALAARIQGVVIIEATIDLDGRVADAKVLRSIPQLDEAAVAAVRQWEFTPTNLNGVAVPVIMTVTVNFTLQ